MTKIKFVIETTNTCEAKSTVYRFLRAPGIEEVSISEPVVTVSETEVVVEYNYTQEYNEEEL